LARADQAAFDASLRKARALLEPVNADLQQTSVRLTGNSHIDAAWLWPWTETVDVVRRTFGTALQLMDDIRNTPTRSRPPPITNGYLKNIHPSTSKLSIA